VYLPDEQTTMVILINTDISVQDGEPGTAIAAAITKELTPDHIYTFGPEIQQPDVSPGPAPTTKRR
jgi:D-alanyl-D-alanine carboxypeptidase